MIGPGPGGVITRGFASNSIVTRGYATIFDKIVSYVRKIRGGKPQERHHPLETLTVTLRMTCVNMCRTTNVSYVIDHKASVPKVSAKFLSCDEVPIKIDVSRLKQ